MTTHAECSLKNRVICVRRWKVMTGDRPQPSRLACAHDLPAGRRRRRSRGLAARPHRRGDEPRGALAARVGRCDLDPRDLALRRHLDRRTAGRLRRRSNLPFALARLRDRRGRRRALLPAEVLPRGRDDGVRGDRHHVGTPRPRKACAGVFLCGRMLASGARLYIAAIPCALIVFGRVDLSTLAPSIGLLCAISILYTTSSAVVIRAW